MSAAITLATGDYDHVRDLGDGRVQADGLSLTWLRMAPEEIFHRFAKHREWEVSEFSLALYVSARARGDDSLSAIPVFPSRMFRHAAFFTGPDGPRALDELAGLRIGIPEWAQTAGVWARGLLAEDHGVDLGSVQWVQGGVNSPGRREKAAVALPAGWRLRVEAERSLDDLLNAGELDAVISARPPASFSTGKLRTVLGDPEAEEMAYWRRRGILPIMHLIVIRRDLLRDRPWVATSLLRAFDEARRRSTERLLDRTATHVPLPWAAAAARAARELCGGELWPYGVEPNRIVLETFLRYAAEQGVTERRLEVAELFDVALEEIVV